MEQTETTPVDKVEAPLPHIYRAPLSRKLAYPVGYELLSENFGLISHWQEARFWFSAHPTVFASEFAQILRSLESYPIVEIEYRGDRPYREPAWHFTIYPVPRGLKNAAREALLGETFEKMRDFVKRSPIHAHYHNAILAIFDLGEKTCSIKQQWPIT